MKGYIYPYYNVYPTVTEGGQHPKYWDNGKENGNYSILIGYTLGLCFGYFGIMEKKMETTLF